MIASDNFVSLWDMLQFDAGEFLECFEKLSAFHAAMAEYRFQQIYEVGDSGGSRDRELGNIQRLIGLCEEYGLDDLVPVFSNLLDKVGVWPLNTEQACRHLVEAIAKAKFFFEGKLFFPVSKRVLLDEAPFGELVSQRFPSIIPEIHEGEICLALGRYTASAFHFIRCLEVAFRALSRHIQISDPTKGTDRSWSNLQRAFTAEIERRWPKHTGFNDDAYKWLSKANAAIVSLQNPYRNETMHFESRYGPDEVVHLRAMIRGIIRDIAAKIDENGEPRLPIQTLRLASAADGA